MPRRRFMKLAGAGGLALGVFPLIGSSHADAATPATLKPTQQPSAFLQIDANGAVTVAVNRLEFGQGVQTALPMILAEELDADWSRVTSRLGDNAPAFADPTSGLHLTGGSSSIRNGYQQYRELGARARTMLLAAGCWLLAAGCWLLAAGCWLLAAGCWLLAAGCCRGALERGRRHAADTQRPRIGAGWPTSRLRRTGRCRHGPACA